MKAGKVILMGAGPGAPDLLTLRAVRLLQQAEVVLFDRLVHPEILEWASPQAEMLYVGKEKGLCSHQRQMQIHRLLVDKALEGKLVVRLKGGDPFVFGRGGEEALILHQHGVSFEIVPGISSSMAVPALAGIPVTHRGIASSFAVFTGHEATDGQATGIDWDSAARIPTAVFLMGVKQLPVIVRKLQEHGRSPNTPVALIERGSTPEEVVVVGELHNIVDKAAAVRPPAVIVVGDVVTLRQQWEGSLMNPLFFSELSVQESAA